MLHRRRRGELLALPNFDNLLLLFYALVCKPGQFAENGWEGLRRFICPPMQPINSMHGGTHLIHAVMMPNVLNGWTVP